MERIVARKLARDLEDKEILPANQKGWEGGGGGREGGTVREMHIGKCSYIST